MNNSLQKGKDHSIQQSGQNGYPYFQDREGASQSSNNGLDPQMIIALLQRYRWLIAAFLVAGAVAAWGYAQMITPIYESKGTLLISSADAAMNDELSQVITKTTGHGTSSTLENELQILQSKKFSRQVARELIEQDPGGRALFPVLWSETDSGEVFKAGEVVVASRIQKSLNAERVEEETDVVVISYRSSSALEASTIVNLAMNVYVEHSTQQNRQAAASTASFLEKEKERIQRQLEEAEQRLRRHMDNSGIVQINDQATGMVNQRVNTEAELQRVNLELGTIRQTIANYQSRLEKLKPGLSVQFSEAIGPRIQNLQEELARYENEKMQIVAKNPNVLNVSPVPPRLQYVDEQIVRLKNEINDLSQRLFTEDDEFVGLNGEDRAQMISDVQNRLMELQIQESQLASRRVSLQEQKNQIDSNFNSLPEGMIELAKLQRDVRINEELYLNVSRQYADISVWKQSQYGFGRIIDAGERPVVPVYPNTKITVLLGIMLGGALAAGFIAVKEYRDHSIKSVSQLRSNLPSLMFTAVPKFPKVDEKNRKSFTVGVGYIPEEMVLMHDPSSIAAESIRRLKNNIIYQQGIAPPKTIALTSPEKGDGKSTIVANLGIAFAEEGYKTLIVGADFRRPQIHKYFGLPTEDGLSDYLNGNITFQELLMLIQNTDRSALKIIAAGRETQNPETIGNTKGFKQFLNKMEEVYDVILIDTPPFGIISDSIAVLKDAEATLVVVRHHKTNTGMLLRTIEELGRINANVTGVIMNDFDHQKEPTDSGYYQTMYGNYEAYVA